MLQSENIARRECGRNKGKCQQIDPQFIITRGTDACLSEPDRRTQGCLIIFDVYMYEQLICGCTHTHRPLIIHIINN